MTQALRHNPRDNIFLALDGYCQADFCGAVYSVALKQRIPFCGANNLVLAVEEILNRSAYPSPTVKTRTFKAAKKTQREHDMNEEQKKTRQQCPEGTPAALPDDQQPPAGKKATFMVQVHYRQNATWQGQVVWVEKNETSAFRSALELIKLIDSAVQP